MIRYMIKAVVTDFSKVLLFAKDKSYTGGLNGLNRKLLADEASYPFFDYFVLNNSLLEYYAKLRQRMPVYVFTSGTIQNHPAIKRTVAGVFSAVISAEELGLSKADRGAYMAVAGIVKHEPSEIVYVDDKQANLDFAAAAGMTTVLFTTNRETVAKLEALVRP
jgi:FMN phosphatase YigB (HAD superfamily)